MSTIKLFLFAVRNHDVSSTVILPYYTYADRLKETIMFRQDKVLRLFFLRSQNRDRPGGRKRIPIDFLKS